MLDVSCRSAQGNFPETCEFKIRLLSDERFKKKKKWGILFPLFVIIKLIKLEGLLGLVFLVLLTVKKMILIGGLILFKTMKSLKTACVALQTAPHHHYYLREPDGGGTMEEVHHHEEEDEDSAKGLWDRAVRHWHKQKT